MREVYLVAVRQFFIAKNVIESLPFKVNFMISAGHLWRKTKGFRIVEFPKNVRNFMLDSGAFHLLSGQKDYPFSLKEYFEFAKKIMPVGEVNRVVIPDYPTDIYKDTKNPHQWDRALSNQECMEKQ